MVCEKANVLFKFCPKILNLFSSEIVILTLEVKPNSLSYAEVCLFHMYHYERLGPNSCEMTHCPHYADSAYNWTVEERPRLIGDVYIIHKYFHLSVKQDYTGLELSLLLSPDFIIMTYYGIGDEHGIF